MRWLLVVAVWLWAEAAAAEARLATVPGLDRAALTVSGLSSGAFFAHQLHVAYSRLIQGAGLVAGGPYACAEPTAEPWWISLHPYGRTLTAVSVCTRLAREPVEAWGGWWGQPPQAPDVEHSVAATDVARSKAAIDEPANLADDRVWLFRGTGDTVVPAATAAVLSEYYRRAGVTGHRLAVVDTVAAAHGFPVEEFAGESGFAKLGCGDYAPPFIIDCDLDADGAMLRHLLPAGFVANPGEPRRERLIGFDQREFFDAGDAAVSLAAVGFVYVPASCEEASAACRLHVAFHGCRQNTDAVGDDFVWDAGYNRWAEANRLVVLYPQAAPWKPAWDPLGWAGNPLGCWDWWGYSGAGYAGRGGKQMLAVRAMMARLLGE